MKRYTLHIAITFLALLVGNSVWGQNWNGESSGGYTLGNNVSINSTIKIEKGQTLKITASGNHTIKAANTINGPMFLVMAGGTLIIKGDSQNQITIDGGAEFSDGFDAIFNSDTNPKGSKYYNNAPNSTDIQKDTENEGFSVYEAIKSGGTLTLEYVTIQNVAAPGIAGNYNGGAIWISGNIDTTPDNTSPNGVTLIKNCKITRCISGDGSALHVDYHNSNISGNENPDTYKITIENTEITNCFSNGYGGGGTIRTNGGAGSNLYLKNVTVKNNFSAGSGGGIYWNAKGTANTKCVFDGCTFSNNIAISQGGAMMLETTFDFTGETTNITGNKVLGSGGSGGGIVVTSYGGRALKVLNPREYTFTYNLTPQLNIQNNTSSVGAGISFNFNTYSLNTDFDNANSPTTKVTTNININGATISNNTATAGNGGGIRIFNNTHNWTGNKRTLIYNIYVDAGNIENNTATGNGGGIYTYMTDIKNSNQDGSLQLKNNAATENGGGIYVDGGNTITLAKNSIEGNEAKSGGGIYINSNNTEVILGQTNLTNNSVDENGGAIYVEGGNFSTTGETTMSGNKALKGGAVYVANGDIDMSKVTANMSNNFATDFGGVFYVDNGSVKLGKSTMSNNGKSSGNATQNGGAIALLNGTFEMSTDSRIEKNEAQYGGGLYVLNNGTENKKISCTGGTFYQNKATAGGGIFASGNIELEMAANVQENTAVNGGGIYIDNGVNMSFGDGLIVANKAESDNTTSPETAYQKIAQSDNLYGAGGGVFMANGTCLKFTHTTSLGIYNNEATYAGADICANGDNTTISLPNPKNMNLKGFNVPGNELYWVEDYVTDDTNYANGLNVNSEVGGIRYTDALLDTSKSISRLVFSDNENVKVIKNYACLDLGYDLVFVTLKSEGLALNDYATIQISYKKDGEMIPYQTVLLTGKAGEIVGLPSGDWNFSTTKFMSQKYGQPIYNPIHKDGYINIKREGLNDLNDGKSIIEIEFSLNGKKDIIESFKRVVNYMK